MRRSLGFAVRHRGRLRMSRRQMDLFVVAFWFSFVAAVALMLVVYGRTHGHDGLPLRGPEPPEEWRVRLVVGFAGLLIYPVFFVAGAAHWFGVAWFVVRRRLWGWFIACILLQI